MPKHRNCFWHNFAVADLKKNCATIISSTCWASDQYTYYGDLGFLIMAIGFYSKFLHSVVMLILCERNML